MRLYIMDMVGKDCTMSHRPLLRRWQWSCAMTCTWMRSMVDPRIVKYLEWARQPHYMTIVDKSVKWSKRDIKYLLVAGSNDHDLELFNQKYVRPDTLDPVNGSKRTHIDLRMAFYATAAAAGSTYIIDSGMLTFTVPMEESERWFTCLASAAASHGQVKTVERLYYINKNYYTIHGVRTFLTIDQIYRGYLAPAIEAGQKDVVTWIKNNCPWGGLMAHVEKHEKGFIDMASRAPDPEDMIKWIVATVPVTEPVKGEINLVVSKGYLATIMWLTQYYEGTSTTLLEPSHFLTAARCGHLKILIWAHMSGLLKGEHKYRERNTGDTGFYLQSATLCSEASNAGHLDVVLWLHETFDRCNCIKHLYEYAKRTQRSHVTVWIATNSLEFSDRNQSVCGQAVRMHDWELLEWALENHHEVPDTYETIPGGEAIEQPDGSSPPEALARNLPFDKIVQFYNMGVSQLREVYVCRVYALRRMWNAVKWAVCEMLGQGTHESLHNPLVLIDDVVEYGEFEIIQWIFEAWRTQPKRQKGEVHENTVPDVELFLYGAVMLNRFDILEWAHDLGLVVFTVEHLHRAYQHGYPELAKWMYNRGGDFHNLLLKFVRLGATLDTFRRAREDLGAPWGAKVFSLVVGLKQGDIANYCYDNGCPFRPDDLWNAYYSDGITPREFWFQWFETRNIEVDHVALRTNQHRSMIPAEAQPFGTTSGE